MVKSGVFFAVRTEFLNILHEFGFEELKTQKKLPWFILGQSSVKCLYEAANGSPPNQDNQPLGWHSKPGVLAQDASLISNKPRLSMGFPEEVNGFLSVRVCKPPSLGQVVCQQVSGSKTGSPIL
jgi:hypothetical protein